MSDYSRRPFKSDYPRWKYVAWSIIGTMIFISIPIIFVLVSWPMILHRLDVIAAYWGW